MERIIGFDLEGGDLSKMSKIQACVGAYSHLSPGVKTLLFSNKDTIQETLELLEGIPLGLRDKILLGENSKDTALASMIHSCKDDDGIDMGLSAEDTGKIGRQSMRLGRIQGVIPALCAQLPNRGNGVGRSLFLDVGFDIGLGKTIEQQAEKMIQHALMSAIYTKRVLGIDKARVGLLTNGIEDDTKGDDLVRAVRDELKVLNELGFLDYIGYVEGSDITSGEFDVLLSDGHTANIALKTGEGQRMELGGDVSDLFRKRGLIGEICGLLLRRSLKKLKKENDPNEYSLGLIIGLKKLIGKIHGSADKKGYEKAFTQADDYIVSDKINGGVIAEIEADLNVYRDHKQKIED